MKQLLSASCAILAVVSATYAQAPPQAVRAITNVRGDLYRVQDNQHYTVFLVTPDGIILADPINLQAATWLKGELGKRFPNRPVKFVLQSHHDFDHASGATVFNDTAELVGQAAFNAELKSGQASLPEFFAALDQNKNGRLEKTELQGSPFGGFLAAQDRNGDGTVTSAELYTDVIPVESTFADRRTVTLGGKSVQLIHPGTAHAKDMAVLLFPAERVVFAVDYLPVKSLPFGFAPSTPREVIDSVRAVEALNFDTIVPGHGDIGTKADVTAYRQYVEDLTAGVQEGIKAGKTVEQLQSSNMLEKYKAWPNYGMQRNGNIAEVYGILKGRSGATP
jgi:glyoxylase-like metal-dependent hydrolase (beta-lactamase superfamily II)